MAASAHDLLAALDARLDDLETTSMVPGSILRIRQEWRTLAHASLRLLEAVPHHGGASTQRLRLLLGSMAAQPGAYPLPDPGTGLMAITNTIGCTADVLRLPTITSTQTREQAGGAVLTNLEAALGRAARWTSRNLRALDCPPDSQIVRLASIQAEPTRPPALHAWRMIGPTDPGVDGAISRWRTAASESITNRHTVTQHALQLASADIALLCVAADAITDRAHKIGLVPDDPATSTSAALASAGRAWRQTARWPRHVRLGGRSSRLRQASADLRRGLEDALRTGGDWRPPDELFAGTSPEGHLAVLHSGLQSAVVIGRQILTALHQLTHGTSRPWLDASHIPQSIHPTRQALATIRYGWLPDPDAYHSADRLHLVATEALTRLVHATPLAIEALGAQPPQPAQRSDDDGPWETVAAPLDPLRAAQDRATLAAIVPSGPQARTMSR